MPEYILSPQSQKRLKKIRSYTLEHFGEAQKKRYMTMLRDTMRSAAKAQTKAQTKAPTKAPTKAGKPRDDIKAGYYSIIAGKHYVYYRIRSAHIDIIDVLHKVMEPSHHL